MTFRVLYCDVIDFINLENSKLEIIKFRVYNNITFEEEKLMFEKILSIKTLKEIQFWLNNLKNDDIKNINGINNSVKKISILQSNDNLDFCLYNLQNKFPNLSEISVNTSHIFLQNKDKLEIEISENKNCKVKNISIIGKRDKHIKLYCTSYKDLESIYFYFQDAINNFENFICIFNRENKVIFESLKSFYLCAEKYDLNLKYLENICENIENMPNLKEFTLKCKNYGMTEDLFIIFITKLLSSNLISINFEIYKHNNQNMKYFSLDELKKLFPNVKGIENKKISILKFNF